MNPIQWLKEQLEKSEFKFVKLTTDLSPSNEMGSWLDIITKDYIFTIHYRPEAGFKLRHRAAFGAIVPRLYFTKEETLKDVLELMENYERQKSSH